MRRRHLIAAVAVVAALGGGVAVLTAGHVLSRPVPAAAGAPPPGLQAVPVALSSASGRTIRGWFAPGEPGAGAILLLHPVRASRAAMTARAGFLHARGHAVMLVDLQAHGESDGRHITFGLEEGKDAQAAVDWLRRRVPGERVGALGVSLGAAALVLSRAHEGLDAVVLEALYPTIEQAVENRLRLHAGALGPALAPLLLWQLEVRLGVPRERLRPIDAVTRLRAPVLLVHGAQDRHTTLAEARRLFARIPGEKAMYAVDGAAHVDLHAYAAHAYEARIGAFFERLRSHAGTGRAALHGVGENGIAAVSPGRAP